MNKSMLDNMLMYTTLYVHIQYTCTHTIYMHTYTYTHTFSLSTVLVMVSISLMCGLMLASSVSSCLTNSARG